MINPYEPQRSEQMFERSGGLGPSLMGTLLITVIMALAALVGILAVWVPEIAALTTPRFGAIGLLLCLNPLIFLVPTLRRPTVPNYAASAFMTFSIGLINGLSLMSLGQSHWTYTVLPFFLAGTYLVWQAYLAWQSDKRTGRAEIPQGPPPGNDFQ